MRASGRAGRGTLAATPGAVQARKPHPPEAVQYTRDMVHGDTGSDARRIHDRILGGMSGPEKLAAVDSLTRFAHELTLAGLRRRMPDAAVAEIERAHFELVLGRELTARVLAHRDRVRAGPELRA